MKKILYVAAAAMFLIAGCKGNGATQPAENAPAQAVGSSDIAFVQVEAVLAQSDLFQSEGAALQEKTKKAQELNADKKYKLILNATSLVDADSLLDITPLVLAKVNELYAADKKADKE